MGADVSIGADQKRSEMNSFSALHFVEAWEMWDFLDTPSRAYREGKHPNLLEMVHTLEEKKRELERLTVNGASVLEQVKSTWDVIDSIIIFPRISPSMLRDALSAACLAFPALFAVREMVVNQADLECAVVLAALSSVE